MEASEYARLKSNLSKLGLTKIVEYLPSYMEDPSAASKPAAQVMSDNGNIKSASWGCGRKVGLN